jgi:hypothetical protein
MSNKQISPSKSPSNSSFIPHLHEVNSMDKAQKRTTPINISSPLVVKSKKVKNNKLTKILSKRYSQLEASILIDDTKDIDLNEEVMKY